MRVLGAILAGGQSRRFGTDKANARWNGEPLITHCVAKLSPQVDGLVICGRSFDGIVSLTDRPGPGLGPLSAINAALHYAAAHDFQALLSVPVDVHPLPDTLRVMLCGAGPGVLDRQTAIGWWPIALAPDLDAHIAQGSRSLESWIEVTRCRRVPDAALALVNINRPEDLELLKRAQTTGTQTSV